MRLLARILRSMAPPAPAPSGGELEELQRRVAALEHALDEQRSVTRAILYAMGHSPNAYRERTRADLTLALRKGRDPAPYALLETFEDGVEAWHADMAKNAEGRR